VPNLTAVDAGGRIAFDIEQRAVFGAVLAPDPDHLITFDCSTTCVLRRRGPTTGATIGKPVEGDLFGVAAGRGVLVATAADGEVRVLDPDTLQPVGRPLPGIDGVASAMSFSDDGRRLLLLGGDAHLRLYDIPSRTQLGDAIPVGIRDTGAALCPDGLEAAVTTDRGIVVWDLDPEHWVEGACAIAGRNLTRAEWDQHIGNLAAYRPTCPQYESEA
jgi:WD40 repeat protein